MSMFFYIKTKRKLLSLKSLDGEHFIACIASLIEKATKTTQTKHKKKSFSKIQLLLLLYLEIF